jgi:hypothetical protein
LDSLAIAPKFVVSIAIVHLKTNPMQVDFKPRIRGLAKLILSLLAQLGTLLVNRIKDAEVKLTAQGVVQAAAKTIDALSDANPDDKAQLQAIFNTLLKEGPFKQGSQAELMAKVNAIDDVNVRLFISQIIHQSFPVGDLLTDTDSENTEQMRSYFRDLLRSENGMIFFRSAFGIILPKDYADTASLLIIQLLISVLEEEGESPMLAGKLVELQEAYQKQLMAG